MHARWDGDDRGHGVGDAGHLVRGASELVAAFEQADWVAEQPELHLLPHVRDWCERDRRLAVLDARADGNGTFILDLEWRGTPSGPGRYEPPCSR
jgi:hypothetical protein